MFEKVKSFSSEYNYFYIRDYLSSYGQKLESIKFFRTYAELEKYITDHECLYFSVYVRCGNCFKKAFLRFYKFGGNNIKVYINNEEYYELVNRTNNEKMAFIEVPGLLELEYQNVIKCNIFSSIDDVYDLICPLFGRYYDVCGTFLYDGERYSFNSVQNSEFADVKIFKI